MSARLNSVQVPSRIAELPHGQVVQFERQLEAAGFTPAMLLHMLENSNDIYKWVSFGEVLYENRIYGPSVTLRLNKEEFTKLKNDYMVKFLNHVRDHTARIVIDGAANALRIYANHWTGIGDAQIQLRRVYEDHCWINVRYHRDQPQ